MLVVQIESSFMLILLNIHQVSTEKRGNKNDRAAFFLLPYSQVLTAPAIRENILILDNKDILHNIGIIASVMFY